MDQPDDASAIDLLAIQLYEADAMVILAYGNAMQSWVMDREQVRQLYREKAREQLKRD